MRSRNEEKKIHAGTVIVALSFLAVAFLILGGCLLLSLGIETIGAIFCIVIGVMILFSMVLAMFLHSHPGHRLASGLLAGCGILICGGIVIAVLFSMIHTILLKPLADMEHYLQVWQHPVTVTATVTSHDSYDDDDDTDYRSFVTYVYNNVRYNDFPYENRDTKEDLTPLGTAVTIQISPKDPTQQISQLKRSGYIILFFIVFVFLGLSALYALPQRYALTKGTHGMPGLETIQNDIKVKIRSRFMRPFLLLCWVGYGFLYWRYSVVLGQIPLIAAIVCGAGWLYCMYTTLRDYRYAHNGIFELRRDRLVEKQELSDSEGSTYTLSYESGDRVWKINTNAGTYRRAHVGDLVLSAYLPGTKKPIVHYSLSSDAR